MPTPAPSLVLWLALLPFIGALIAPWLIGRLGAAGAWVLALIPATLFVVLAALVPQVSAGEVLLAGVTWVDAIGVRYSQRIDGLSLTFALLITGIGALIVVYAGGYLKGYAHQGRFMMFLLAFMGAMLGLVLADDLLSLFIFYELTSIASFLLIGFDYRREAARRAAFQALLITGTGGLALLAGLVLMRVATGETSVSAVLAAPDLVKESGFYLAVAVLVILGAFTKSAQVPFHSWLPNAMEAPTPVSAYLHSATMVKAGVFVLMRFNPALGDTAFWATTLMVFGGATFLTGVVLALRQTDLKQILAYTTVASLGLLVMLTGIGTPYAIAGAVFYLVAHAFFKGGLFMIAGAIDHETGTRDMRLLGGLGLKMPITMIAAVLSCLSMAGLPPLIGFVAKEVLYDGTFKAGIAVTAVALMGNALMFALAAALLIPFFGKGGEMPKRAHEAPLSLWLGPIVLAICGLVSGLLLASTMDLLVFPMASAVAGSAVYLDIHLIPEKLKPPVILTLITIALGAAAFIFYGRLRDGVAAGLGTIGWGPDRGFDQLIRGTVRLSMRVAHVIQPGSMRTYMALTFIAIAATILIPLGLWEMPAFTLTEEFAPSYYFAVLLIAVAGLFIVIVTKSRLAAIVSLGIQGLAVALIFMLYGAPDLSFTQFMVETLSVVILALVIVRLDLAQEDRRPKWIAVKDASVALACGAGFGLLLLSVIQQPFDDRLSDFFIDHAFDIAHGRNVVNVILVDFRALDTLGEIAVVMAAGLAILALIRLGPKGVRR
ncbi:MAG: putative monovalent cation/H+ antiporter subunit A [Pseudomonadota bacterium]